MEDDPAHHLDVERALPEGALGGLTDCGEGLEEQFLKRLAVLQPLLEVDRLLGELRVGELFEIGLERGDVGRLLGEPLDTPAFAGAQYFLESA